MKDEIATIRRITIDPETARIVYGVDTGTLANLRCHKQGPPYLKVGRKVLYPVKEFEAWLFSNPVKTNESEGLN